MLLAGPRASRTAASQQVHEDEEDARQEAEAEPADPTVDPHAHRQHHPVRLCRPPSHATGI